MNLLLAAFSFVLALLLILVGVTRIGAWSIERAHPPIGSFITIDGARIHHVHVPEPSGADLPPIVFIHGASGNLKDQMLPIREALEGRAEMLFVDRPGHGWSQRGNGNETPYGQAGTIARLMDELGIQDAIVVGHSFGGAIAAAFALSHPEKLRGLVFLAPATHPWPGGGTSWYYEVASIPVLGRIFAETVALPGGLMSIRTASTCVFAPNPLPEAYADDAGIGLTLRPATFRSNAIDVAGLYDHVVEMAPRYSEIDAPTVIVTGDHDTVVYPEIHSRGLERDIAGAELVWISNMGHKPDWIAADLAAQAIERVAGRPIDLQAAADAVRARVANDGPVDGCSPARPETAS
jgi:pimeloyl-ACP methyl ester carboxylesterase